jgi:hypothetical protein
MGTQIADAVITVNNDSVGIVPNSLSFNEGFGEQNILAVSDGGGKVSQVFSNNLETNFANVSFTLRTTTENIEKARAWKIAGNTNVIIIAGEDADGNDFIRTFTQAAMTLDYQVQIQAEGTIGVEFKSNAAT